jgi:hypothetical protein
LSGPCATVIQEHECRRFLRSLPLNLVPTVSTFLSGTPVALLIRCRMAAQRGDDDTVWSGSSRRRAATSAAARFMAAMAVPPAHGDGRGAVRALGDDGRVICRELNIPTADRSIASPDDDSAATTRLSLCPAVHTGLGAGRPGRLCARCAALRNGRPATDRPIRAGGKLRGISRASRPGDPGSSSQRGLPRSRSSWSLSRVVHSGSTSAGSCLPASSRGADVTCCSQYCCSAMGLRCAPRSSAAWRLS